jgi:hypothetical protein
MSIEPTKKVFVAFLEINTRAGGLGGAAVGARRD